MVQLGKVAMIFKVSTEGQNRLGLSELCERFANEQWLAGHMLPHEAAESVLDAFKRAMAGELELLQIDVIGPAE
jgi:hypothetical protein